MFTVGSCPVCEEIYSGSSTGFRVQIEAKMRGKSLLHT